MHTSRFPPCLLLTVAVANAAGLKYQPCPVRGPLYPSASNVSSSSILQSALKNLTLDINGLITTEESGGGTVVTNSTSFSVVLFSAEDSSDNNSLLYQYHHTASGDSSQSVGSKIDADSIYRAGDISMVYTAWLFLIQAGHQIWDHSISEYIPELSKNSTMDEISTTIWSDVTLGDLAGHMAGIGRDYGFMDLANNKANSILPINPSSTSTTLPCGKQKPCNRQEFLAGIAKHAPVYLPSTTPIYSHAAYQLLGYALDKISGTSYPDLLETSVLRPLALTASAAQSPPGDKSRWVIPGNKSESDFVRNFGDLSPALGLYTSARDLATAGRAILRSSRMPTSQTRRWFQPHAFTSNLVNTVGRPWEIYAGTSSLIQPITPIFTKQGWVGDYTSYFGFAPDYGIGFAILAADSAGAPDLNALADLVFTNAVPAVVQTSAEEAVAKYAGSYGATGGNSTVNGLSITQDDLPGLSVQSIKSDGKNIMALIAEYSGIELSNLDMRLYPTNLVTSSPMRIAWRAVFQDKDAPVDAGTPTCVTWQNVDQLVYDNVALDEFVFELDTKSGAAVAVDMPAIGKRFARK